MADTTALVRSPIAAGGNVAAILAQTFDDAWRIGGVMAASGLTAFKSQEEACAAIMAGAEVGLPPFAALQSFMYVNGRLSMWGDAMLALVRARGHKVEEWRDGTLEGGDLRAFTKATRTDTGEVFLEEFSIDDAKRAGLWQTQETVRRKGKDGGWYDAKNDSPWFRYPKRMLKYRARGFALRDGFSDILRGIKMVEEVQDYPTLDDVPMQARVVGSEDFDQRPANERGGVVGGQAGKDAFDDLAQRMSEVSAEDELDAIWEEAERSLISQNRKHGLAEYCEAVRIALRDEAPIPAPPRFTEAPEPSPFPALKEEGEAVADAATYNTWRVKLNEDAQARCTPEERQELRTLFDTLRAKFGKKKAQPESAGAGGTDKDAGNAAAESGGVDPGGDTPPASEFDRLKQACLDCLQAKAKRRALAEWRKEVDACASLTDAERADLDKIEENVRGEISK